MKEQIEKTRKFLRKQRLTLDKDLTSFKTSETMSMYLEEVGTELLAAAGFMESRMHDEHDPRLERAHMLIEELGEAVLGLARCDEVETLDGLSDLVYVAIGTALAFDLPLDEGLDEVCDSNLTKTPRKEDDPRCRDKGPDYRPANLKRVLSFHRGIDVQAERTSCVPASQTRMTTVHVERRYSVESSSWWIYVSSGGVTGYESMREDRVKTMNVDGWCACAGTLNKWDKLHIPAKSMQQIQEWLEQ